ncbi:unnamed protein product [Vitrella brassicaformis CCMP3155]|uniref:Uncharacterized protein n=1 Tax=Vitrella brassicaformis (strain CCMP3155) TaxID=1169540 RepID=A0A0G4H410_VITBC|nr:unnamed protein product [Vitrella brassicaformis CCMP3155]|eukprot:CEM38286.1 unnamed protein product [Vitrella brassicaformis CCMP3155]
MTHRRCWLEGTTEERIGGSEIRYTSAQKRCGTPTLTHSSSDSTERAQREHQSVVLKRLIQRNDIDVMSVSMPMGGGCHFLPVAMDVLTDHAHSSRTCFCWWWWCLLDA